MNNKNLIQPEEFYSNNSEKTKFNWFCYEYALELQLHIEKNLLKKLKKKNISKSKIADFCIHYSKSMKVPILNKLSGHADLILSYQEIEIFFPKLSDKMVDKILNEACNAWESLLDVCVTCPNRCVTEKNNFAPMFDADLG